MADTKKVERTFVVPKEDIDRLFDAIYAEFFLPRNSRRAQRLRGIAYANTFCTERTITTAEAD